MINFKLDSDTHTIAFDIHPKGEEEPIEFKINKYKFSKEGEKFFIEISDMETNREWMNIGIENFISSKKIEIPAQYEKLIKLVM